MKAKYTLFHLIIVFALCIGLCNAGAFAKSKDLLLVIDTSLSMAGYGGKNIMPLVKQSLPKFIDQLDDNDSLTLITFDTEVKIYPTVYIKHKSNKDILNKYISMVEAGGKWTYTMAMMTAVFDKAKKLQAEDPDREQVIIIITDAIDDPPPYAREHRYDVKKIAKQYSGNEWFIFFVNLGQMQKDSHIAKVQKEVKESISQYTKVIDAREGVDKIITQDLKKDIDTMAKVKEINTRPFYMHPLFIIILAIALLIVLLLLLRRVAQLKVKGALEYWNNELLEPTIEKVNLTAKNSRTISIGKDSHNLIRIHDFSFRTPILLKAVWFDKAVKCQLIAPENAVQFVNRDAGDILNDGDIFKIANYTFKYYEG